MRIDDDDDFPSVRRGPGCVTVVLLSALTSALVSAGTVVAMQRYGWERLLGGGAQHARAAAETARVRVPRFAGMAEAAARDLAKTLNLRVEVRSRRTAEAPAGSVLEQEPSPFTKVARGQTIEIVLSEGPPGAPVTVPDLLGKPIEVAQAALADAGLRVSRIDQTGRGSPGTVTGMVPRQGETAPTGSGVLLVISPRPDGGVAAAGGAPVAGAVDAGTGAAAPAGSVEVPNVVGTQVRNARTALTQAGLAVGRVREVYDENRGRLVVIRQTPAAHARVARGTRVELIVNQGD